MVLLDDASDGDSMDDLTECGGDFVETREGDLRSAEDSTSDDTAATKLTLLTNRVIGTYKTKWGKIRSSTHTRRRWQNILIQLPGVISRASDATAPFEIWNSLIADKIFDDIVQHTSQYVLTIHRNFSPEGDAKLTDKTGIKAFIDLCLAGALRSSKQNLEELWGTDGDSIEKFRVVMNQNRARFLIRYINE